jgi:hypothetical protein
MGQHNTAIGFNALVSASSNDSTAVGSFALNAGGNGNTAIGANALRNCNIRNGWKYRSWF